MLSVLVDVMFYHIDTFRYGFNLFQGNNTGVLVTLPSYASSAASRVNSTSQKVKYKNHGSTLVRGSTLQKSCNWNFIANAIGNQIVSSFLFCSFSIFYFVNKQTWANISSIITRRTSILDLDSLSAFLLIVCQCQETDWKCSLHSYHHQDTTKQWAYLCHLTKYYTARQ